MYYVVRRYHPSSVSSTITASKAQAWGFFNAAIHDHDKAAIFRVNDDGTETQLDRFTAAGTR